jgi:hypothetical protein
MERPRKGEWTGRGGGGGGGVWAIVGYIGKSAERVVVANKEGGEKGLDASRRNGEGAFGLHGWRGVGGTWEDWANLRSGLERLLERVGAGLRGTSRSSSASSESAAAAVAAVAARIEGVLGNGKDGVGAVGAAGGEVGGGVVGEARALERDALVCTESAAEMLGAKLR